MAVTVTLTDEQLARVKFEQFLEQNKMSTEKNTDGTYMYKPTQNMWVAFKVGMRVGRESANGTCDF